jgi:integrase/recombinase XerD
MEQLSKKELSLAECVDSYDLYAREVRGLAASTREIQRRILHRLCRYCFADGPVAWDAICFTVSFDS